MMWMKENDMVVLLTDDNGQVLSVEIPNFVTLEVVEASWPCAATPRARS